MKTKREVKTGKIKLAAAVSAAVLLIGSVSQVYGAETENTIMETPGGEMAAGTNGIPVELQPSAEPAATDVLPGPSSAAEEVPAKTPVKPETGSEVSPTEAPSVDFTSEDTGDMQVQPDDSGQTVQPPQKDEPGIVEPKPGPTVTPEKPQSEFPGMQEGTLSVSREKLQKGIKANSDFRMTVLLKNTWTAGNIRRGKMNLELPEGVYLHPDYKKETFGIPEIRPGSVQKVTVRLHAGDIKEDGRTLRVRVRTSFCHQPDETVQEQQEVLLLPVHTADSKAVFVDNTASYSSAGDSYGGGSEASSEEKKKMDPMVPRIIVSQFDYDRDATAGKTFGTNITICNTSEKLNVENMVMSIEAGENSSLQGTSNIVYIKNLKPQETYRTEFMLKTQEDGKTDSADITLNFKYEYLKNEERTEVESAQKISIPVQIPDRFSVGDPQTSDETVQGEEFTVSLPYVNKGKIPVSNVEAVIKTDMKAGETYKYLGNVEAGSSGTLDFFVTSEKTGDQKVHITLTYENSAGQEKSVEKEKIFRISEAEPSPEEAMMNEEELAQMAGQEDTGKHKMKTGIFAAGGGGIVLALAAGFMRMKKRKRREENEEF